MMKNSEIKTITCHDVYNHGASLQELALLSYLETIGFDASAISYKPDYLTKPYRVFACENPKWERNLVTKILYILLKLPLKLLNLRRIRNFDRFSKKYIKATTKKYTNNDQLKKNLPDACAYICGSDQIWNSLFENGKDPAFYLDFAPHEALKLSYAASFSTDYIHDEIKDFVRGAVGRLDYISVRETSGVKILKDLGITSVTHVLDPVFLMEREYWVGISAPIKSSDEYILVYDFDTNIEIKRIALSLKVERGLKIITVSKNIKYADKNYFLQGPEYFLALVGGASIILTNSFHAVAFSIIFKKRFFAFDRKEKINTRIRDLLKQIELLDRVFQPGVTDRVILDDINYDAVDDLVLKMKVQSETFLSNALGLVR